MVHLHRDVTWLILIPPFPDPNPGAPTELHPVLTGQVA
jgi:hypothetical protein